MEADHRKLSGSHLSLAASHLSLDDERGNTLKSAVSMEVCHSLLRLLEKDLASVYL